MNAEQFNAGGGSGGSGIFAFANFNGVAGVSIRKSSNIASITRSSAGVYVVTFTSAAPDANYIVVVGGGILGAGNSGYVQLNYNGSAEVTPTTSGFTFAYIYAGASTDAKYLNFAVITA